MSGQPVGVLPSGVLPVQGQQNASKANETARHSLDRKQNENKSFEEERGPLKEIFAQQDSLYRYLSWEDPVRTLSSYLGALSVLFCMHYLPLTQWTLKYGATALGIVSVAEFANRQFGPNTVLAHFRPSEYKKFPEKTLNATLRDIHDFAQYGIVELQKVVLGENLDATFIAFITLGSLYWFSSILSPFSLAILGLTSLYIAPLVASPRARQSAQDIGARAQELADSAVEQSKSVARDAQAQAADLSSKAKQAAVDTKQQVSNLAQGAGQNAADLSNRAKNTVFNATDSVTGNAKKVTDNTAVDEASSSGNNYRHDGPVNRGPNLSSDSTPRSFGNLTTDSGPTFNTTLQPSIIEDKLPAQANAGNQKFQPLGRAI